MVILSCLTAPPSPKWVTVRIKTAAEKTMKNTIKLNNKPNNMEAKPQFPLKNLIYDMCDKSMVKTLPKFIVFHLITNLL